MRGPADPLRIMIVEDDVLLATDLGQIIEGVAETPSRVVCTAATAAEALVGVRETAPEIAFVDANLHDGRTGPEVAELLSKHFGVVVVLAAGEISDFAGAPLHAVRVLPKPFTPAGVADSLRSAAEALDGRALRRG